MKNDPTDVPAGSVSAGAAQGGVITSLPEAMTGRASPAKAAVGDQPVFAYLSSLPQPQRGIAEAVDALAATTLPDLHRAVKWGMAYYGVGEGWCFSCGGFAGHVKLMFINGATLLDPVPAVTPVGMGKAARGVELETVDDLDEGQITAWIETGHVGARDRRKTALGAAGVCGSTRGSTGLYAIPSSSASRTSLSTTAASCGPDPGVTCISGPSR
jgi:hypothetical protein